MLAVSILGLKEEEWPDRERWGNKEVRRSEGGRARLIAVYDMSRNGGRGEEAIYCKRSMRVRRAFAIRSGIALEEVANKGRTASVRSPFRGKSLYHPDLLCMRYTTLYLFLLSILCQYSSSSLTCSA